MSPEREQRERARQTRQALIRRARAANRRGELMSRSGLPAQALREWRIAQDLIAQAQEWTP